MTARIRWSQLSASAMALLDPLEDDFLSWVIAVGNRHEWLVHHARPARSAKGWATPIQGHSGAPDLLLARAGIVRLVELKRNKTYLKPDQKLWAAALADYGLVWRPRDALAIEAWLSVPVPQVLT